MSGADDPVTCPLCGVCYGQAEGRACHVGCPLERGCQLLSCPHCGYEVPAPTRLTRWLERWFGSAARSQ